MSNFDLPPVDLSSLYSTPFILILGKKRVGKTRLAKYITKARRLDQITVVAGNEDCIRKWSEVTDDVQTVADSKLFNLRKKQEKLIQEDVKLYVQQGGKSNDYSVPTRLCKWLVLDGVVRFSKYRLVEDLALNHRNLGIGIVCVYQCYNQVPPYMREQVDYIAMLNSSNDTIKKVHENYVANGMELESFRTIHKTVTRQDKALWINYTHDCPPLAYIVDE